jgi:propionyl-CoA carboxylase alpha chain
VFCSCSFVFFGRSATGALTFPPLFLDTNFIETEYPDGFHGIELEDEELFKMMAMGRMIHESSEIQAYSVGQGGGPMFASTDAMSPVVCSLNDGARTFEMVDATANDGSMNGGTQQFQVTEMFTDEEGTTTKSDQSTVSSFDDMDPGTKLATAVFDSNDHPFTIQMLGVTDMGFVLGHSGSSCEVSYQTHEHHAFNRWMLAKPEIDTSKYLLSPMPGALVSVNVEVGEEVQPGQSLAVVEAMKMQNVLSAEKKATVKAITAQAGDILAVDQIIVEFE